MSNPLPSRLAQAVSVALGTIGFASMVGIFSAFGDELGANIAAGAALAFSAALVFAGENAKSRLLNWAIDRSRESGWKSPAALLGAGGFAFFLIISVCLSHDGLTAGERAFLGSSRDALSENVATAESDLTARNRELARQEARDAASLARVQAEINAQPRDWRGDRERDRLRDRLDALEASAAARIAPIEQRVAAAEAKLAEARAARDNGPKGFASLTISIPFIGSVAFVAWMVAIGIEFLTGFLPFVAKPSRRREVYLSDILEMDGAGLELIEEVETVRAIGSRAQSIATKATHIQRARLRSA